MTGRGAGFCAGNANSVGGRGMGMGMGRGRGLGRGFGRSGVTGPYPVNVPFEPTLTSTQELEGLKQQAEFLQNNLSQVSERIERLEKEK